MSHLAICKQLFHAAISCTLGLALLGGCSGEEDDTTDSAPPAISEMQFSPESAIVAQITTVSGTFNFSDDDADVNTLNFGLWEPGIDKEQILRSPSPTLAGRAAGQAVFAAQLNPLAAGSYTFELWVTDGEGNDSNRLEGTIEAH